MINKESVPVKVQDYHAVHKVQELVKGYLEDEVRVKVNKM